MTSKINTSKINANFPVQGQDNSSQGFRDNFSYINIALDTAASEITSLQQTFVAPSISVGSVSSGPSPSVVNVGNSSTAVLNFTLPQGPQGNAGPVANFSIGTVTTGTTASVVNVGNSSSVVLNFTLPGNGPAGAAGSTIRNGTGAPSSGLGADGDFYIDTLNQRFYGPRSSGAWPNTYLQFNPPPSVRYSTNTSETILATDSGNTLVINNTSSVYLTLPANITTGSSGLVVQAGQGAIGFVAATGTTIISWPAGLGHTAGQGAMASWICWANTNSVSAQYFIGGALVV